MLEPDLLERSNDRAVVGRTTEHPHHELQVLDRGEIIVEAVVVPQQAHEPPRRARLAHDVEPENRSLSTRRAQQHGADPQEGALAGSVAAHERHDIAGIDPHRDTTERPSLLEATADPGKLESCRRRTRVCAGQLSRPARNALTNRKLRYQPRKGM